MSTTLWLFTAHRPTLAEGLRPAVSSSRSWFWSELDLAGGFSLGVSPDVVVRPWLGLVAV